MQILDTFVQWMDLCLSEKSMEMHCIFSKRTGGITGGEPTHQTRRDFL